MLFAAQISAADGQLDASFGVQGRQTTFFPNTAPNSQLAIPEGIVVQPDGKIVVAGSSWFQGTNTIITLTRYNPDGNLDSSFGSGGIVRTDLGPGADEAKSVALQSDGKIVVAGSTYLGIANSAAAVDANTAFALVRYNPNGSLDASFGAGGVVVTDFFPTLDQAFEVLIQPDGRIVAAGFVTPGATNDGFYEYAVVRYNANGSLDSSFGAGGHTFTDFLGGYDIAYSAALQADGKIVLAGASAAPNWPNLLFSVARYNPDGSLDSSFDADGKVITTFGGTNEIGRSVKLDRAGRIVVVGDSNQGETTQFRTDFAIARYNFDGSLDASFDGDGRKLYGVTGGGSENAEEGFDLVIQPDNKIIVTGGSRLFTRPQSSDTDFEIFRLNQNGSLDVSWGAGGEVYTDFGIFNPPTAPTYGTGYTAEPRFGMAAALQPDGRLVVTGGVVFSRARQDFGVARYLTGIAPAARRTFADFDGDGKSDIGVYRGGTWYLLQSRAGSISFQFGLPTDRIAPADYDGDGKTDAAVFRDGTWYILQSRDGVRTVRFGSSGDQPQPADYDGDGRDDVAVWRASDGVWYVLGSRDGFAAYKFGQAGDRPTAADFDGDGKADYAVYRGGTWYLQRTTEGFAAFQFGIDTDKTIVGDYDGDGRADAAVWRDNVWYVLKSTGGYTAAQYGDGGDVPAPADYDGDGRTDYAVYRSGVWWMRTSAASGDAVYSFGLADDVPIQTARVR